MLKLPVWDLRQVLSQFILTRRQFYLGGVHLGGALLQGTASDHLRLWSIILGACINARRRGEGCGRSPRGLIPWTRPGDSFFLSRLFSRPYTPLSSPIDLHELNKGPMGRRGGRAGLYGKVSKHWGVVVGWGTPPPIPFHLQHLFVSKPSRSNP